MIPVAGQTCTEFVMSFFRNSTYQIIIQSQHFMLE